MARDSKYKGRTADVGGRGANERARKGRGRRSLRPEPAGWQSRTVGADLRAKAKSPTALVNSLDSEPPDRMRRFVIRRPEAVRDGWPRLRWSVNRSRGPSSAQRGVRVPFRTADRPPTLAATLACAGLDISHDASSSTLRAAVASTASACTWIDLSPTPLGTGHGRVASDIPQALLLWRRRRKRSLGLFLPRPGPRPRQLGLSTPVP